MSFYVEMFRVLQNNDYLCGVKNRTIESIGMANKYFEELINSVKPDRKKGMDYDTGNSAGLHSRGNVLCGAGRFLKSFRPSLLDVFTMKYLF